MQECTTNKWWSSICKLSPRKLLLALACLGAALLAGELRANSLWQDSQSQSMFSDRRARERGDILTILVQENATSSKENTTRTAKKTGADMAVESFFYAPKASGLLTKRGRMPALKFDAKHDFEGGGRINNAERITARIAVRVIDQLPNGNLVIEGTRQTSFSGEVQDAVLRGVVRQEDIAPNNTVFSYQVADASITYVSKGSVSNVQRKGWFTRTWEKITPF